MNAIAVAHKELLDHLRDGRALTSTGFNTLMGPIVVWLMPALLGVTTIAAALLLIVYAGCLFQSDAIVYSD
jgi:hypothetical protein